MSDEDDVDPGWSFNLEEKLEADRFPEKAFLRELNGHDFTLAHIQKYGFVSRAEMFAFLQNNFSGSAIQHYFVKKLGWDCMSHRRILQSIM